MTFRARHERALAEARRRGELAAARDAARHEPGGSGDDQDDLGTTGNSDGAMRPTEQVCGPTDQPAYLDVKVPVTATTLAQWAATWVLMCADSGLVDRPLNDDEFAREHFNLSAKQLRNIRNAATTGALKRRARELGVLLPTGYVDRPEPGQRNDVREFAEVSG